VTYISRLSAVLLEELNDLGAQQTDEGRWKHGFGVVGVLEVPLRLFDHFQQRRQQATVLQNISLMFKPFNLRFKA